MLRKAFPYGTEESQSPGEKPRLVHADNALAWSRMPHLQAVRDVVGDAGIQLIVLLLITFVIATIVGRVLKRLSQTKHVAPGTALRLIGIIRWTALFIFGLVALQITGVVAQAWAIISATLAALAVGFVATWSLLSNMTAALILLTFRPFRVDDEVEVLDADKQVVKGRVADLNLMFTTIVDGDVACRVPNNLFLQKVVRVTRQGVAPDPSDDTAAPFF